MSKHRLKTAFFLVAVLLSWLLAVPGLAQVPIANGESISDLSDRIGLTDISAGRFTMGSGDSSSRHRVTISHDYWMGSTEVTQAQFQRVMGFNPSHFSTDKQAAKSPVEMVSWYDAVSFCNKLSDREGLLPVYRLSDIKKAGNNIISARVTTDFTANGYRLPTEAEWEFAARGGTKSQGFIYAGSNEVKDVAWIAGNSANQTHQVASKRPNELGLYDMSGNVWEWCQDWYGPFSDQDQSNPMGPASGTDRVYRGGSWYNYSSLAKTIYRGNYSPDIRLLTLGFRVMRPKN